MFSEKSKDAILPDHTHEIILKGYFGKKNKSVEEKVRCFLIIMLEHIKYVEVIYRDEDQILNKYISIATEMFTVDTKNPNMEKNVEAFQSVKEIMKDEAFIYLLENINKLTYDEANLIYKIAKIIIALSNVSKFKYSINSQAIHNFIENHLQKLIKILLKNLDSKNKDYVIIIVGKLFRRLFHVDSFFSQILTVDFFKIIYSHTNCEKFVLSQECFKILFQLVECPKYNLEISVNFFNNNAKAISEILNAGINLTGLTKKVQNKECIVDDFYYMKRETLILLEKILVNPTFEQFSTYYVNKPEHLKTIMIQLNNKCEKIVLQAVDILYFFFLDIETKERGIKLILHANKDNFYKFFEKNDEIFSQNSETMEKKSFILYELERLENYLD